MSFSSLFKDGTNPELIECLRGGIDTALLTSINENKSIEVIEALIDVGANIHFVYDCVHGPEYTFMYKALQSGRKELVELLINKGYRPNRYDMSNICKYGDVALLERLKESIRVYCNSKPEWGKHKRCAVFAIYAAGEDCRFSGFEYSRGKNRMIGENRSIKNLEFLFVNDMITKEDIRDALKWNSNENMLNHISDDCVAYLEKLVK